MSSIAKLGDEAISLLAGGVKTGTSVLSPGTANAVQNTVTNVPITSIGSGTQNAFSSYVSKFATVTTDAAKNTDEAVSVAKNTDEAVYVAKNADEATTIVKNADDEAAIAVKQAGKQTPEQILTKKNALIAAGTIGGVAISAIAADNYFKKNGKKYNIISIDDKSSGSDIKTQITIQAGEKFTTNDIVKLENTNCIPPIEGEFNIEKIISKDIFIIKTQNKVTTKGTNGTLTFYTTFESQFAQTLKEGITDVTSSVGGGLATGLKSTIDSFFIGLGISPENLWILYSIIFAIFVAKFVGII